MVNIKMNINDGWFYGGLNWQMAGILKILKKENGPRALSAPPLELNTIIFKHVYWYMQQISGERLQDHWSSGFFFFC